MYTRGERDIERIVIRSTKCLANDVAAVCVGKARVIMTLSLAIADSSSCISNSAGVSKYPYESSTLITGNVLECAVTVVTKGSMATECVLFRLVLPADHRRWTSCDENADWDVLRRE